MLFVFDLYFLLRYICYIFFYMGFLNIIFIRFISIFNLIKIEVCIVCVEGYFENKFWKVFWVEVRLLFGFRT